MLYGNAPSGTEYNDVYPINSLRNLALDAAQTDLVLLVDVDFIPSRELAQLCHAGVPAYGTYREMGVCGAALVVPAFDVSGEASSLPSTQGELASLWEQRKADIVSMKACQTCHAPIDYPRWFDTMRPYIVEYQDHFEPYIITLREGLPRYDERFRGHGKDKVSFLYEVSRVRPMLVLPGVFLIHRAHDKSESWHRFEGPDRNPDLTALVSVLWHSFQRQVQDTSWKRGYASNLSDSTACVRRLLASDMRAGNAGGREGRDEPAPGSTHNASRALAEVEHLHGDHHPAVTIKFGNPALRYKYNENGIMASMEVHAWIRGCVVGFSYLVVVEYPDGRMSWKQDLKMLDGASSLHVVAVFVKPQPKAKHRFAVWVVDTHPGLGEEEKLLAARDVTFDAPIGPIPYRNLSALLGLVEADGSGLGRVEFNVVQAFAGLPLVMEWKSQAASKPGDWIGMFRHEMRRHQMWTDKDCIFSTPVAAHTHGQRLMSNATHNHFVIPYGGGPWVLAYFAGGDPEPVAFAKAQDPSLLFLATSLTGYSSRRNQFITQLLFHMEYLWLARSVLNVGVVAPTFVLNARNHSQYEAKIRAARREGLHGVTWGSSDGQVEASTAAEGRGGPRSEVPLHKFKSILGLLPVDFHELFDPTVLAQYSGNVVSRRAFEDEGQYVLDVLVVVDAWAIYGQACSSQPKCDYYECKTEAVDERGARPIELYGKLFWVKTVVCIPAAASGETLRELIAIALRPARAAGGTRFGVAAVVVNHLFAETRPTNLREEWADDERVLFNDVLRHLAPAPHLQAIIDSMSRLSKPPAGEAATGVQGGGCRDPPTLGPCGADAAQEDVAQVFVAAHWRRGDRGHAEMGEYGQMMWNLSEPHVFACNLNHLLDRTPEAKFVFVASNSGTEADIALLREQTRAPVRMLRDVGLLGGWKHEYEALVAEMFVCAQASAFLAAGASEYYLASSISRIIMRMRWLRWPRHVEDGVALLQDVDPEWCRLAFPRKSKKETKQRRGSLDTPGPERAEAGAATDGDARAEGWEGVAVADGHSCCPGGTEVKDMGCEGLRQWLVGGHTSQCEMHLSDTFRFASLTSILYADRCASVHSVMMMRSLARYLAVGAHQFRV